MNKQEITKYLTVIKRAVQLIEANLEDADDGLLNQLVQSVASPVIQTQAAPVQAQSVVQNVPQADEEWVKLRKKHVGDLLGIKEWPEAVPPRMATTTLKKEDQINRANSVLDMMIDRPLEKLDFLDFGCGEGWITQQASKRGVQTATGYDVRPEPIWSQLKGTFTTKYEDLKPTSYDAVFLYDVLDHCEDPMDVMDKIYRVSRPDAKIYVRCHPWTSKHANHIYKFGLNKAYIHLFLNWHEQREIVNNLPLFTRIEKDPLAAYHWWFHNFNIVKERPIKEDVHPFFLNPAFRELLMTENQIDPQEIDNFIERMQVQFVDYVLTLKAGAL